ncbi:hypothetical protein, partial [Mesorhizobium sp. M2D.F.Ca.ET.140.01.1.1]|uniref:hypothetical protein n=1 Tax=Mesorhizobium sp. M2D.F.Ca.ET.140.01.1.1 TaxID=2496664 RepID=UPI0016790847
EMEQAVGIAGVENDRLDDEERLDALARALMYGFVDVLLVRLKNNKDALARSRFPDLRKKFAEIKTAAEEAAATEGI